MIKFSVLETGFGLVPENLSREWIGSVISLYGQAVGQLSFVFCSDDYLLDINKRFLSHDYYTDIITFDTHETPGFISGEIFISLDRVKANALNAGIEFEEELARVIIHGVLHLLGFGDKTDGEKAEMRRNEDRCMAMRTGKA